jgi:5-methylcytosine-specific restriction endonuclease McrA
MSLQGTTKMISLRSLHNALDASFAPLYVAARKSILDYKIAWSWPDSWRETRGKTTLIYHDDSDREYDLVTGACDLHLRDFTKTELNVWVLSVALGMIIRDELDPKEVHKALWHLKEYRQSLPLDVPVPEGEIYKSRRITVEALIEAYGPECKYCGKGVVLDAYVVPLKATVDHVIPRCLGGQDVWENCVVACWGCNMKKGTKTLEQWNQELLE